MVVDPVVQASIVPQAHVERASISCMIPLYRSKGNICIERQGFRRIFSKIKRHPPVVWAQRKDKLLLTIELDDVKDQKITLTENKLTFRGVGGAEKHTYEAEIEFYQDVDQNESKYVVLPRNIPFVIKKKEEGEFWPRLIKEKVKIHWIKTDFDKWKDEDDSDYEEDDSNMDLESMMQKMGGMGVGDDPMGMMNKMGGTDGTEGGGDVSTDSDDEELLESKPTLFGLIQGNVLEQAKTT
ncbi:hypothetical protein FSP39_003844 [Pinctada imbricata]|uniref:CS domain-containing protein n=1 Tax=Pinctada imbricata TaxID=66713 RepID=A0AA89CBG5_PINIB|nr:hypothetical protein FSP39_003844 [Pinctada imbricata]